MNNLLAFFFEDTTAGNSGNTFLLIMIGVVFVAFIALSYIPQRRKQKQMAEMSRRIKAGDKIKTIGGIVGTVKAVDEENNVYTIVSGASEFNIDRGCVYSMEMLGIKDTVAEEKAVPGDKIAEGEDVSLEDKKEELREEIKAESEIKEEDKKTE